MACTTPRPFHHTEKSIQHTAKMPSEDYYCLDNFFYKMTDLESPRKNNDCYFYYYSTCTKGDSCTFRHEPSALGCETTCSFWKEGKCINVHCNFRHMELRKNRKQIPCYWESQPGGCKKQHCPFMHASAKSDDGESSDLKSPDVKDSDLCNKKQVDSNFGSPVVDPLVVNFEEESDNESAPTQSPIKIQQHRVVKVKTLEEIKLERIQAESAAYYSYPEPSTVVALDEADFIRSRIIRRLNTKSDVLPNTTPPTNTNPKDLEILSLEEIRKRKQRAVDNKSIQNTAAPVNKTKRQKVVLNIKRATIEEVEQPPSFSIKTLDEIRADRKRKVSQDELEERCKIIRTSEAEVTSTSTIEEPAKVQCAVTPMQRLLEDEVTSAIEEEEESLKTPPESSSKLDDLLLEDDDYEMASITLRAEEDILKDIDNLLNE